MMRGEIEVTYSLAFKVWWAIMWRTLPLALLAGVALGFVFGIASAVTGLMLPQYVHAMIGLCGGMAVCLWVLKRLMTNGFGKYRLAVLEE